MLLHRLGMISLLIWSKYAELRNRRGSYYDLVKSQDFIPKKIKVCGWFSINSSDVSGIRSARNYRQIWSKTQAIRALANCDLYEQVLMMMPPGVKEQGICRLRKALYGLSSLAAKTDWYVQKDGF